MEQIIDAVRSFDGVLVLSPDAESGFPEVAWGDHFFYYAPDGRIPTNTQPYGTVVITDYPDDTLSRLGAGRWRVNIHVGRSRAAGLTAGVGPQPDFAASDIVLPHPVYGTLGWVAVVMPGEATTSLVMDLLRDAHEAARSRAERRAAGHA